MIFQTFLSERQICLGTLLSNDDGSNSAAKQSLRTCVLNFGTFLCRSPQNYNVKWPNLRFCGEHEQTMVNFSQLERNSYQFRQLASRVLGLMRFRATINDFSLFYVFQALQICFIRFDMTNIRGETNFWTFCFGPVSFASHGSPPAVNTAVISPCSPFLDVYLDFSRSNIDWVVNFTHVMKREYKFNSGVN